MAPTEGADMMQGLRLNGELDIELEDGAVTDDDPATEEQQRRMAEQRAFDWAAFLTDYSKGHFPAEYAPDPPPSFSCTLSEHQLQLELPSFAQPLYPATDGITPAVADDVEHFYLAHDFLPPPRAEDEPYREAVILEYDLYRQDQKVNFDCATQLLQSFFGGVCTFSLFRNRSQVLASVAGPFALRPGEILTPETSLCGHCILRRDGKIMQVHDLAMDWRFRGNPYVKAGVVKGYVGLPITLPACDTSDPSLALPSGPVSPKSIAVGVINVMCEGRSTQLDEREVRVLENVKNMLEGQIRATWAGWKRSKEARMRKAATTFIDKCLVDSQHRRTDDPTRDKLRPSTPGAPSESPRTRLAALAVKSIRSILPEVDFAAIIDLAPIHVVKASHADGEAGKDDFLVAHNVGSGNMLAFDAETTGRKGGDEAHKKVERTKWEEIFESTQAWEAIAKRLEHHERTGQTVFDPRLSQPTVTSFTDRHHRNNSGYRISSYVNPSDTYSGLEPFLPPGVCAHLAIPFFSADQPDILILLASRQSSISSFGRAEVAFVRNVGVALSANRVHEKLLIADKAKTTFLSSVSHELRTPLHGLLGQLDLIRDVAAQSGSTELDQLCSSARTCGLALQQILNDVLDFGKMSQETANGGGGSNGSRETVEQIARLVEQTAQLCVWQQQQRTGSMPQQQRQNGAQKAGPSGVDIKVEIDDRWPGDWRASVDASGLQRVLLNLITNSLKYTTKGSIVISLDDLGGQVDCRGRSFIQLKVADTGKGMDAAFLARLFQPFTQADSFSPGAGLGLHITKTILARMDGSVSVSSDAGVGSTFTVTLPVLFLNPARPSSPSNDKRKRKVIRVASASSQLEQPPTLAVLSNGNASPEVDSMKESATATQTPDSPPKDDLKVLVVDDDPISRRILVAILRQAKVTWLEAPNGVEALRVFPTFRPNLIWTDVSMPEMDGITAAGEIRQMEAKMGIPRCYIVAITGLGSSDPRTKMDALLGRAAIDEWRIKGQHGLEVFRQDLSSRKNAVALRN